MTDALLHFGELLQKAAPGFDPRRWKVVRHLDKRKGAPDLVELLHLERDALEFYQADQGSDVFGGCEGIFSFVGLPGRRALFIGAYVVRGVSFALPPSLERVPLALRPLYEAFPETTGTIQRYFYDLMRDVRFAGLEMRVVVDWGQGALAWHQWNVDKPVVELRDPNALEACPDYGEIDVSLSKLAFLFRHEDANPSWRDKLSAVGGIYLLTDHLNHRIYVGQAGGDGGFWARWRHYSELRTGNVALDPDMAAGVVRPDLTTLSILDVVPRGAAAKTVLDRMEARWKRRLCSRQAGYNRN